MPNYYPIRCILIQLAAVCYTIHSYAATFFHLWNKCSDMNQYASVCLLPLSILTHPLISTTAHKYLSDAQICTSMLQSWKLGSKHPLITLRYLFPI